MPVPFSFEGSGVLVTGGSEGIGLGLARRFMEDGARVTITGRDADKLAQAAAGNSGLMTLVNDIGIPAERDILAHYVAEQVPDLRVVINNAGIQRRISLADDEAPWADRQHEIDVLFSAPVHLNHLLVPILLRHGRPSLIANVTSGGALIPQPFAPLYSACKAALHSYTMNLRFALAETNVSVVEIIPPAVRTTLAGSEASHGVPVDEFCDAIFAGLKAGTLRELGFGPTTGRRFEERLTLDHELFADFSGRIPVKAYRQPSTF